MGSNPATPTQKREDDIFSLFYGTLGMILANGCKSLMSPNSGNHTAKSKGVHREVKSEDFCIPPIMMCPRKVGQKLINDILSSVLYRTQSLES